MLTLRVDFYDRPLAYPELGRLMDARSRAVLPLGPAELRAAIEGPAGLPGVGLRFEGSLVGDLLYKVRDQAGALALFLLAAAGLSALALGSVADARAAQRHAEEERTLGLSRQLAAEVTSHLASQPDLALLLSMEANRIDSNAEARSALLQDRQSQPDAAGVAAVSWR